jgi:hypothetical protein
VKLYVFMFSAEQPAAKAPKYVRPCGKNPISLYGGLSALPCERFADLAIEKRTIFSVFVFEKWKPLSAVFCSFISMTEDHVR